MNTFERCMNTSSRRQFLQRASWLLSAVAGAQFLPVAATSPKRRFKIGACDWSIGKQTDPAAFEVAKRIGLDGVQVSLGTVADGMKLRQPDVQKTFLRAAAEQGI